VRTKAAVLHTQPGKWEIVDVDIEPPRQGELMVKMAAAGLCHSDDHAATGDIPLGSLPMAGGHEGAGVVTEVGPNTPGWSVGDHVVLTFLPACGLCRWCSSGMQNLCDSGAYVLSGTRQDGSRRMALPDGTPVGQFAGVSAFSQFTTVSVQSAVKIAKDLPIEPACLTSCGVTTGWGSAVNSANVRPGDVVIVVGAGGIGMSAVQGAASAGASMVVAVDTSQYKRSVAGEFGATHAVATIAEAGELARSVTNGQGADSCIIAVGVATGDLVGDGVNAIRKGGTVVMTALPSVKDDGQIPVSMLLITLFQKRLQGSLFGEANPMADIPKLLALYKNRQLKLDEMITTRYSLEDINRGFEDMRAGTNIRGVITFD
jgi:S-(hydroxymethyl)glutathione dehydrogenase/alcohol dehydrogenase